MLSKLVALAAAGPSMVWAVSGLMNPSLPVVRPDSSSVFLTSHAAKQKIDAFQQAPIIYKIKMQKPETTAAVHSRHLGTWRMQICRICRTSQDKSGLVRICRISSGPMGNLSVKGGTYPWNLSCKDILQGYPMLS